MSALQFPAWLRMAVAMLVVSAQVAWTAQAFAQIPRDPTVPPVAALPELPASSPARVVDTLGPLSVMVRDGKSFVVKGTRLYAQGQMLGTARIERIAETEIWLREGKQLRKVQLFSGINRRSPCLPAHRWRRCGCRCPGGRFESLPAAGSATWMQTRPRC